jgi:uncharacterized protein (TIGR02246 family)
MDAEVSSDSPAAVSEAFVAALNAGDLTGALALYRDDAVMLAPDGGQARGAKAISELLAGIVSMQVQMTTRIDGVVETGDIAIAAEQWTMRLRAPDGTTSDQSGRSIVLFTREHAGWRFLIDAPWGL